ncbi:MAG TPA: hypothetical protein ENK14_05230, partial [Caldithrix sp.]|nr:hypothetical protein [Caldithrix sp.]
MFYRFGRILLTVIFLLAFGVEFLLAQPEKQSGFHAEEPVLITSAGQSADVLMVKLLAQKAGLKFIFEKLATPGMVDSVKSVILVCGGSSKGLGAARIDKEQEFKRIQNIL